MCASSSTLCCILTTQKSLHLLCVSLPALEEDQFLFPGFSVVGSLENMSAIMGALSGSKDMPPFGSEMDKENKRVDGGETSEVVEEEEEEEELSRRFSSASVASSDAHEEDEEEDGGHEIVLGPQVPLKEQLEMDKDDESLRRWKEQLLGSIDLSAVGEHAEPEVHILSLTIMSPGRSDLVLPMPLVPNSKGYAFGLKDGSKYRLKFSFVVSSNIVSGLKYTNTVWKTGVRVEKTKVMLGTFSPQPDPYIFELEEETTPSGLFARGSYSARSNFVDDDGKVYLDFNYSFEIRKEWPATS